MEMDRQTRLPPAWAPAVPLTPIIEAFRAINSQKDFSQAAAAILDAAVHLFGAESAALLLVNKTTGDVDLAAVHNLPEEQMQTYQRHPARAGALAEILPPGEAAWSQEIPYTPVRTLAEAGWPHARLLPIRIQDKTIGYLTLAGSDRVLDQAAPGDRLRLFLEFTAQTIENAYLIYQLRQQNGHLELMMTKLQNTQNHLRRSEKMALVGKMASSLAHEIRNPLTIIGTTLQLVFEKMEASHADYRLYESMIGKVRAVDQTLKELLVLARPAPLHCQPVNLAAALGRVITFIEKKYASRGVHLNQEIPEGLPWVVADAEQLERILINLLLNAWQFLPEGGCVRIRAGQEPGQPGIWLTLADTGPGIPQEDLTQIFEPFFTTRHDGTGLGLFLVRHWLEEMNGTIVAISAPGQGAEFRLRLPMAAP